MNSHTPSGAADATDELAALILTLHETGQRLEELTGGEVDAVTDRDGRTFLLRHAQDHLRMSEASKQAAILNALPADIAMLDAQGVIVSVNESWREFGDANAYQAPGHCVGINYLDICDLAHGKDADGARETAQGIRSVLERKSPSFSIEYPCHSPTERRWFLLTVVSLADDSMRGAVVMHLNITTQRLAKDAQRESERRFTAMLDNVDLVAVMLDLQARIIYCNDFFLRLTGWQREEVMGRNWFEVFAAPDAPNPKANFEEILAERPTSLHNENQLMTRSGEHRLIRWNNSVLRLGTGAVIGAASIGEDITDRKAAEGVLAQRASELERFHRLSVGRELQMVELKRQINEMARKAGQEPAYNLKAVELDQSSARLDLTVSERTKQLTDSAIASLNMMEDAVHQREQAELAQEKLSYLAYYDALTGLANQSLFLQRVQAKLLPALGDQLLVVFALDIVRFKSINDAFGREAGDDLLKQIAERLVSVGGGDPDRFARIGADRFGVVATELTSAEEAGRYTNQRLDAIFHPPFRIADNDVHVSVKAGIALFPVDGVDADTLLRNAEAALKKAKVTGELFVFFTQAMTERVAERMSLEHRLRQAIENEEFVLHYQPKVSLVTGKVTGAEALIRWNDPTTGLVPPNMFIPILEDTGLIQEVGRWAMRKAMSDYLRWRDLGMASVPIAVNVSALQLRNRDFIDDVRHVMAMDVRAAEGLELEITESMIMDDIKQAVATLQEIRSMGVRIAIDDFGTGFSSLAYLSKLPIDTLKVDRAFVTEMTTGPDGFALVNTIITLAHSLQLKVVAEGVETDEQSRLLQSMRCDEMQGYLFSKPIARDLFESRYVSVAATA